MKKGIVLFLTAALAVGLCACGSSAASGTQAASKSEAATPEAASAASTASASSETSASSQEAAPSAAVAGGWTMNADETVGVLPDDAQKAFDKATEGFVGNKLTPVALIGRQVVAGMNYAILCKSELVTKEPVVSYQVAIIYQKPDGEAEISNIADFNVADYTQGDGKDLSAEKLVGAWETPEDYTVVNLPAEVQTPFDKALDGWTGSRQEPLAYLASQVVAGKNYAVLCHSTLVTKDPVSCISVVTIYEDLQGNASVSNICAIDPADFNK